MIARRILQGDAAPGSTIFVDSGKEGLEFKIVSPQAVNVS